MFISIQVLQKQELNFDEQLGPGALELTDEIRQLAPMQVRGRAELIVEHESHHRSVNDIRLRGSYSTRIALQCARCLEPIERDVAGDFDLLYRPLGATAAAPETSISAAETEIGYYKGEGLQLEQAMTEQLLLAVPLRELCSNECKGLCPRCGKNLNQGLCQCRHEGNDVRWSPLRNLRDELKQ